MFFSTYKKLAEYLWNEKIPLISIRSFGLIGFIRVITREHHGTVINLFIQNFKNYFSCRSTSG